MSHADKSEVNKDNSLNIPEILADFFLKKIKMPSESDDSDKKHKRKKSKHKKRKHKKSKRRHRSSSSDSSTKTQEFRTKKVVEESSSEEMGIKRLKKIKNIKMKSVSNIVFQSVTSSSAHSKDQNVETNSSTSENLVFYGPSLELLLSGVESNGLDPKPNHSENDLNEDTKAFQCDIKDTENSVKDSENFVTELKEDVAMSVSLVYDTKSSENENPVSNSQLNSNESSKLEKVNFKYVEEDNFKIDMKEMDSKSNSKDVSDNDVKVNCSKNGTKLNGCKNEGSLESECNIEESNDKKTSVIQDSEKDSKSDAKNEILIATGETDIQKESEKNDDSVKNKQTKCDVDHDKNKSNSTVSKSERHCNNKKKHSRSHSRSRSTTRDRSPYSKHKRQRSRSSSTDSYYSKRKKRYSRSRSHSHEKMRAHDRKKRSYSRSRTRAQYQRSRRVSRSPSPRRRYSYRRSRSRSYTKSKNSSRSRARRRSRSSERHHSSKSSHKTKSSKRSLSHSKSRSKSKSRHRSKSVGKSRSRSKSKEKKGSVEKGKIDQAKILETARKNVLKMMKSGTLPEGLPVENLKKEQLMSIQAGGKSVQELTDFCQRLSQKENEPNDNEETEDKDDDESGFIHHPFKVKEPSMIKLNIKNAVQLPIKTHAQKVAETARLSSQFPVSSGNKHKQKELEWVPVVPESSKSETKPTAATVSTSAEISTASIPLPEVEVPPVPPPPVPPMPISYPCPPLIEATTVEELPPVPATIPPPLPAPSVPPSLPPPVQNATFYQVPAQPIVQTYVPPTQPIIIPFSTVSASTSSTPVFKPPKKLDISSLVARRFKALTKLQENPNDIEALRTIEEAHQTLQEWVESQQVPGLFTGSTDAKVLTAAELCGPFKYYKNRKDILSHAPPVTEGKGMSLLKKMGWNPGEGLGKNKEGSLEPLVLDIKTDKKGLVSEGENSKKGVSSFLKELQGKHPVSALMELCSKRRWKPPLYTCIMDHGPPHKKLFCFKVEVNGVEYQPANPCSNKKIAKADSAVLCLQALNVLPKSA